MKVSTTPLEHSKYYMGRRGHGEKDKVQMYIWFKNDLKQKDVTGNNQESSHNEIMGKQEILLRNAYELRPEMTREDNNLKIWRNSIPDKGKNPRQD